MASISMAPVGDIGAEIKRLREAAGLGQKDLARALGLKVASQVSQWETGERVPGPANLSRIAAALCVPVTHFEAFGQAYSPTVRLPPRQKGRKVAGVVLPLTPAAVSAFEEFIASDAWRGVTSQTLAIIWGRAVKAVNDARAATGATPVPKCSPYHLRHSFAGMVLDATGGDLQATKELLQHADLETTLRYARGRIGRSVGAAAVALAQIQSMRATPGK